MTYSVHFGVNLGAIPDDVRQEIGRTMEQVAAAVSTIPPASPFWSSMKESLLQVDVMGYRVVYGIDSTKREIRVVEVERIRR